MATLRRDDKNLKLFHFTQGIDVDARLATHEVQVQRAWAEELSQKGYLSKSDFKKISSTLSEALNLIEKGTFDWRVEEEDIHMNLERFVTDRLGELGKRMHLGRSRNDLIATTLRLFVAERCEATINQISKLGISLYKTAKSNLTVAMPGFTHLQNAQPVYFSQVLSSHAWPLVRDLTRFRNAHKCCLSSMPLGAAALNGTPLPLNLKQLAKRLGFRAPNQNAYDAVADRDFILESLNALAILGVHLSRISEDIIYWASSPVALIILPKAWSTGSSIMPNKRNPDVAELTRAKSAKLTGAANTALTLVKALPTSYNSDLHELKSVMLNAFDVAQECLTIFPHLIEEIEVNKSRADYLLSQGHVLATEIADHLTSQGLSFRESYAIVADLVALANQEKVQVHDLAFNQIKKRAPQIDKGFFSKLGVETALERRGLEGGSSRKSVLASLDLLREAFQNSPKKDHY